LRAALAPDLDRLNGHAIDNAIVGPGAIDDQ
jgi:hypothetical protein